jgi:hypothetical protein
MFDHRLLRQHRFALLDPTQRDRIPSGIETISLSPSFLADDSEHLLPRLMCTPGLTQQQRGDLLDILEAADERGDPPPLCALLDSDSETEPIAAHLRRAQVMERHRGASIDRTWLRIHDGRVFAQLMRMLPSQEQPGLFGPISRWTINLHGEWIEFEKPLGAQIPIDNNRRRWPHERIANIGALARTLARIGVRVYRDTVQQSAAIEAQVERARSVYGLSETEDLVEFAYTALTISEGFDQHPEVQPLIRDPQDDEGTRLPDRLAQLDKSVWQSLIVQPSKPETRKP